MKIAHIPIIFFSFFISCFSTNANHEKQYKLQNAFTKLSFDNPVDLQHAGDGTNRIFVVSQKGLIYVFKSRYSVKSAKIFLDIRDKVTYGDELGLLGLAFHPDYKNNGYFYVNYTTSNPLRTVIARYKVRPKKRNLANKNSERILLEVNQPYRNHNGGQLAFGPDGYLYIALGDGGSGGDTENNGQDKSSLLGKILRIDVDCTSENNYCIPSENPFAGNTRGYKEEIYAYGLRNPWRFSFDPVTDWLWAGDVGQDLWEEIDIIENGKNYGWRIMEGNHCYNPSSGCDTSGLTLPVWEYGHDDEGGCSITGGYVYRGTKFQELYGKYIYGDYCDGRIWALSYDGVNEATNELLLTEDIEISSFGVDKDNEIYICDLNGKIYKLAYKETKNDMGKKEVSAQ